MKTPVRPSEPTPTVSACVRLIPAALLMALCALPQAGAHAASPLPSLQVDVVTPGEDAPLVSGQRFTLSLRFEPKGRTSSDDLVAIIAGPYLPTRLFPVEYNAETREATAEFDIEAPSAADVPRHRSRVPLTCTVAQRKGAQLVTLATRTVYVTVDLDPSSDETQAPLTAGPTTDPVEVIDPPLQALALMPARIKEQSLLPATSPKPSPAYWQRVKGRIVQRVREHQPQTQAASSLNAPTVHFRLFANGTAQEIRLDPGSGDSAFDQALLRSVADAQPFPPFPAEVTDPHLDVHLTLPSPPNGPTLPAGSR